MALEEAVLRAWAEANLGPRRGVVVGVSGGPDSTALLLALHRLRARLALAALWVAFFDHGWRDVEAERDLVARRAASLGLPAAFGRAGGRLRGEAAARRERRAFLLGVMRSAGLDVVALAHTADDQAETVLLQSLRGTVVGQAGMRVWDEPFFRPLLSVRRSQVHAYVRAEEVARDPTNEDPAYARNRVRRFLHEEMRRGRDPVPALLRAAERAREEEAYWDDLGRAAAAWWPEAAGAVVHRGRLAELPSPARRRALRRLFLALAWEPSEERLRRLEDELCQGRTPSGLPRRHVASEAGDLVYLGPVLSLPPAPVLRVAQPGTYLLSRPLPRGAEGWCGSIASLPADARYYEPGLALTWQGRRLAASDVAREAWRRPFVPLLCRGKECLAVAGSFQRGPGGDVRLRLRGQALIVEETPHVLE